ncbi:MAG: succinate dehydrogenase, cytochrome b556 subunit [Candidatus Dasytiphilus stammeri]
MLKKQRPINLNLTTLKFPLNAIASILQRVSGVINIITVGIFIRLLDISLSSPEGFIKTQILMKRMSFKLIIWSILTISIYHLAGGIRHILMDFGYLDDSNKSGTRSAQVVFIFTMIFSIMIGVLLW